MFWKSEGTPEMIPIVWFSFGMSRKDILFLQSTLKMKERVFPLLRDAGSCVLKLSLGFISVNSLQVNGVFTGLPELPSVDGNGHIKV